VPVVTGRAPKEDDELLLNPVLAKRLDVALGDRLDIAITRSAVSPYERASLDDVEVQSYEVVGTGPVPVAYGQFAGGVALTLEGYRALLPSLMVDFELDWLDFVLVAREGDAKAPVLEGLEDAGIEVTPADIEPDRYFGEALAVDRTGTESVPDLLAILMLLTSAGLLAYGVSFTLARSRGELAVVQAVGFDRRMLHRTARWVGLSQAAVVLAIAVPVGVVVGRGAWRRYAEGLGVEPVDQIPWAEVSALAVVTLVVSVGLSALVMAIVLRRGPAATLRAEE